jgi:hypothetical protein
MADYQSYKKIQGDQAIIANSVGPAQVTGISTGIVRKDYYYNRCWWSVDNGGCCYLWTVPQGTTTIQFELVAGGGGGGPGRCCTGGYHPGGSGAYGTKILQAHKGQYQSGCQYTICAGGTTRCSCCGCCNGRRGCGFCGCVTYVQGSGLSNFCARGGSWGHHKCASWCYTCKMVSQCNWCNNESASCVCGVSQGTMGDFALGGTTSGEVANQYCNTEHIPYAGGTPGPYSVTLAKGRAKCGTGNVRGCCYGHSLFPGGGGFTAGTEGSNCWGDYGQGGLVVVTYWS